MGAPRELASAVTHLEHGDWQAAHAIVQKDEDSDLSCWAHGIVHVMEEDLANARYRYGKARRAFPGRYSVAEEIAALKRARD
jgi:hypothetical protein